jgi:filamentous hemagglutinin
MVNAGISGSRGRGDGKDTSYSHTHVDAGNRLTMASGGDTNIVGGVAGGKRVSIEVGTAGAGDLNIASLQDSSHYDSNQQSLGGSISVGAGKMSASISASRSKVDGEYLSVNEQSGIVAGEDGFDIEVHGNTDLAGGKIASTERAVQDGKNSLTTETLMQREIANHSRYEASSQSISIGGGYAGANSAMNGTGIGSGNASGSDDSITGNGVSGGAIVITDRSAQWAKTGKTVEQTIASINTDVSSDKDSSGSLTKGWDGLQLQAEVNAQAQATAAFGKEAGKGIGAYATDRENSLRREARAAYLAGDKDKAERLNGEADNWSEGGAYRIALHTAAGALTGRVSGEAVSAAAMPEIAKSIEKMELPNAVKQGLAQVAAAVVGAAAGGAAGVAGAVHVEANNRQLHQSEYDFAKKNAKLVAKKFGISEQDAEGRIVAEMQRNSDQQTADATGGKHDYEIRSVIGCQNLNCNGYKNDQQYANHDYNSQLIALNYDAYNAGRKQLDQGKTYNDLVTSNIKKDPIGATLSGVGMVGVGVATGGGIPAFGMAATGTVLGLGVNGVGQMIIGNPFDWISFGVAGATGAAASGMGFLPEIFINIGGALTASGMQGKNPNNAMAGAAIGTAIGFPVGSKVEGSLNNLFNPWYRQEWKDVGAGVWAYVPKSPIPSWFGNAGSGTIREIIGGTIQNSGKDKK